MTWDVFIAHAGADTGVATDLHRRLTAAGHRVFLDRECLLPGDAWDEALPAAQRSSAITLVLVSRSTDGAWYQREEIAAAIAQAREDRERHRVVPVYLDGALDEVPYGLRRLHGVLVTGDEGLGHVVARVDALLRGQPASTRG